MLHEPTLSERFVQADQMLRSFLPAHFHDQLQTPLKLLDGQSPVSHLSKGGSIESISSIFNPLIEAEVKLRKELPKELQKGLDDLMTKPHKELNDDTPLDFYLKNGSAAIPTIVGLISLKLTLPEKFRDQIAKPQWALGGSTPMRQVALGLNVETIKILFQPSGGC